MAAGLGLKTFATGDILTAADTNGYLMQGVWVFASAAARTSAVTSPQEGNMSYLKDTNSTEYYDGSAWTAVGAGGITIIESGNLTGASITTGTIPATYKDLRVIFKAIQPATNGAILRVRLNGDTGTNYRQIDYASNLNLSWAATSGQVTSLISNTAGNSFANYTIPNYANTTAWKAFMGNAVTKSSDGGDIDATGFCFAFNSTSAISSITFFMDSGNFTAGTYEIWGVK